MAIFSVQQKDKHLCSIALAGFCKAGVHALAELVASSTLRPPDQRQQRTDLRAGSGPPSKFSCRPRLRPAIQGGVHPDRGSGSGERRSHGPGGRRVRRRQARRTRLRLKPSVIRWLSSERSPQVSTSAGNADSHAATSNDDDGGSADIRGATRIDDSTPSRPD